MPLSCIIIRNFFTRIWNVKHTISSSIYPKSNECEERMVDTFKTLYKKAIYDKGDLVLAIIKCNATPKPNLPSPAVMLTERRHRTLLSVPAKITPMFKTTDTLEKKRNIMKKHFDTGQKSKLKVLKEAPTLEFKKV